MVGFTLKLDKNWDIYVDASGNLATCDPDYSVAQNVSNAIRLFKNDAYFDPDRGLPHFNIELKEKPLLSVMRQRFAATAEAIKGVKTAQVINLKVDGRELTGTIVITLIDGAILDVKI